MAFPRNSEGQLDIKAYVKLLLVDKKAAERMENELENENPETINYFYDNLERVALEVNEEIKAAQLQELNERYAELERQEQEARQAFSANMLKTLDGVTKNDGTPLTPDEQIALNEEMTNAALELMEEFAQKLNVSKAPIKSQAELEKEKKAKQKREREEFLVRYRHEQAQLKQQQGNNPQAQSTSKSANKKNTNSHNKPGCTIF